MQSALEHIHAVERRRAQALVDGDVATLEAMTDSDYVHVEASGQRRNRSEFLAALSNSAVRFARYDLSDNLVRVYGDTAIVTGCFENESEHSDGRRVKKGRHCRAYVLREGRWMNVLHQATEIQV